MIVRPEELIVGHWYKFTDTAYSYRGRIFYAQFVKYDIYSNYIYIENMHDNIFTLIAETASLWANQQISEFSLEELQAKKAELL